MSDIPTDNVKSPLKRVKVLSIIFLVLYITLFVANLGHILLFIKQFPYHFLHPSINSLTWFLDAFSPYVIPPIAVYRFYKMKQYGWELCAFIPAFFVGSCLYLLIIECVWKSNLTSISIHLICLVIFIVILSPLNSKKLLEVLNISRKTQIRTILFSFRYGLFFMGFLGSDNSIIAITLKWMRILLRLSKFTCHSECSEESLSIYH
jgi:hypothetical protein